jgi:DNA polymerase-3 subunit beta
MKISCKRENLSRALLIVSRIVKSRATLPVLSNILISTDKGRIKLVATDLESAVSTWIGAKIDVEGAITLPARTLVEYVQASSDETISIEADGSDARIKSDRSSATIKGLPAEEFPIIPKVTSDQILTVAAVSLKAAILATSPAAALDETRPVLAGILFTGKSGALKLVSTDSYRLAEYTMTDKITSDFNAIVPQRTASELGRILPSDDTKIEISAQDNQVQFKFEDFLFLSRQIEGNFPDYEQIIPKDFTYELTASKNELAEAIKVASIFARESGNNLKISGEEGVVLVDAVSAQTGDSKNSVTAKTKGSPMSISFNAKFITDALNVIAGDEVTVSLSGALSPGLITSKSESGFRYVIMPLRNE